MNHHNHDKQLLDSLQSQFGKDIDSEVMENIAKHMKDCPDCKIYVDSVKHTVKIYRTTEKNQSVPEDVSDRLFKTLKLKRHS